MKNSLLDIQNRSLSKKQLEQSFDKFTEMARGLTMLPQTEFKIDKGVHTVKFVPRSTSYTVPQPSIVMEVVESCQSLEKLVAIQIRANNCGTCRNGGVAKLDSKNIGKIDQILANARELFENTQKEAIKEDLEQVGFQRTINHMNQILKVRTESDGDYSERHFLGKVNGRLEVDRRDKEFEIRLDGLSSSQVETLAKVITSL